MNNEPDEAFFNRADAVIDLVNTQMVDVDAGPVSASTMYAAARFNAWRSAIGFHSGDDMMAAKSETIEYFTEQYKKMLSENLDDYIENFDRYLKKN